MFKNDFQGGNYFEIFNPATKDPLVNFKVTGPSGIQKIYDKDVKGSVLQLDGIPTTTKISLPKESKQGLSLIQRCIVFQVNVKSNHEFSMEIGIADLNQNKRNLLFSTSHKELSVQPLSARIPIKYINRAQWTNLVFDLTHLINEIWKNQTFKSIESFSISANCKLRRIFTLKNVPMADYGLMGDENLSSVDFPEETDSKLQLFNINETKSLNPLTTDQSLNGTQFENSIGGNNSKSKAQNVFKIAFGTKVSKSSNPSSASSATSRLNQSQQQQQQQQGIKSAKSQNQLNQLEQSDLNEYGLKSNRISPLSMSNGHLNSSGMSTRRKSESENQNIDSSKQKQNQLNAENQNDEISKDKSTASRKTSWSQQQQRQQSAKQESINSINESGNFSNQGFNDPIANSTNNNNNKSTTNSNILTTKIPHPPPQSTRPTSSSARKIRLSTAVKNSNNLQQQQQQQQQQQTQTQNQQSTNIKINNTSKLINNLIGNGAGGESSNEEDIQNNSSKTLVEYSAFKSNNKSSSSNLNPKPATTNTTVGGSGGGDTSNLIKTNSNNSLNLNDSINDLIQALRTNNTNVQKESKATLLSQGFEYIGNVSVPASKNMDLVNLEESSSNVFYSFSSRPKPLNNKDDLQSDRNLSQNNSSGGGTVAGGSNSSKVYDYRKYTTSTSNSSPFQSALPPQPPLSTHNKITTNGFVLNGQVATNPPVIASICKDSLNVDQEPSNLIKVNTDQNQIIPSKSPILQENKKAYTQIENFGDLMDSFEANMLQHLKAEMDSNNNPISSNKKNKNSKKSSKNSDGVSRPNAKNSSSSSTSKSKTGNTDSLSLTNANKQTDLTANQENDINKNMNDLYSKQKSPDADFIETLQREASGIQSPLSSEDNNPNTSEKYNFDAMTSSIEDTTTSLSKKNSNRRTKFDETNNYQDEMNISLYSNLPSKSLNLKDLPSKYSPLLSQASHGASKLQNYPITEEPAQYDDSQADIDEIVSSDSEQEVDLLYDPSLNCYYDPKTCTYYELNLG